MTCLWSSWLLFTTTTWISNRHSDLTVQNATNNVPHHTCSFSTLHMPAPHPLAEARNPESPFDFFLFLIPTFYASLSPNHSSSKTYLQCIHSSQLLWHQPQSGHYHLSSVTARTVFLFDFSLPFLPLTNTASPPGNPGIILRCMATRGKPIILNPQDLLPVCPHPPCAWGLHPAQLTVPHLFTRLGLSSSFFFKEAAAPSGSCRDRTGNLGVISTTPTNWAKRPPQGWSLSSHPSDLSIFSSESSSQSTKDFPYFPISCLCP